MRGSDASDRQRKTDAGEIESPCILDVRGLTARYDGRLALDDVSFELDCGSRVAVVGPNGAGKTTLFRAVAGLLDSVSGQITVHGHTPGIGVCVAYVQQRRDVDWSFPVSVADVVMMGRIGLIGLLRRPSASDRARVAEAMAAVGISDLADRQIGQLSGGQQQRMFIARALAQEAELVLMDEPFTGLDAGSRRDILTVLDALRLQSVSVMVATHDLELAAEHFDRVLLLNHRLIGFGQPDEVFAESNLLEAYGGRARFLDDDRAAMVVTDPGCCAEHHDG
jgi:ABC-type Mn2+/Zn2+ transport system ATPase subunit